jgi:uracil-DNA glycosylase
MRVCDHIACDGFPCLDVRHEAYVVPEVSIRPDDVSIVLISEAAPGERTDYYYAAGDPLFAQTTVQAFQDAGVQVASISEIVALGIYLTTAVKCGKTGYGIKTETIKTCSRLLEQELSLFPNVRAILLMGDVAIKALNQVAKKRGVGRVVPAGSTYKIRGGEFMFGSVRVFPSYLQAGPSFGIEKSKRRMIAEDIAAAMRLVRSDSAAHP